MSHIHGVNIQNYSTQILESSFTKSKQDLHQEQDDHNNKSFTELISYDSVYRERDFLNVEDPFISPATLPVEQLDQTQYFSSEPMDLKTNSQSILSQLESLSQYKPTSTMVKQVPESDVFQLENLGTGDTLETLTTCLPVLESHMSTPIFKPEQVDMMENLYDHEILSNDSKDVHIRQSVIRIKKNIK